MSIPLPASADAPWLASAVWLVARGTVLLASAALLASVLRGRSAASRHLVWALGLGGMLVLPALTLAVPHWEVPFVSVDAVRFGASAGATAAGGVSWGAVALAVWMTGALLVLVRTAMGMLAVHAMGRRSTRVADGVWSDRLNAARAELGLREPVRLLRAPGAAMPMTWGILRPTVLIPAQADAWSPERARAVLLHELAHVARRDCLWQTVAGLGCAAYWFHPGAWWAARRMREEREQACDDRVLAAGTRASEYARHLLEVARAFRPGRLAAAAAVGMAGRSQLEGRVIAVLDGARARGAVGARAALLCCAMAALALFPLAAASPSIQQPRVLAEQPMAPRVPDAAPPRTVVREAAAETRVAVAPSPAVRRREPVRAAAPRRAPAPDAAAARVAASSPELFTGDEATIAALMRAARDVDPQVRRSAVWALGQMDDGLVVSPLLRSMSDRDPRVRSTAATAIGEYATRQRLTGIAARPVPTGTGNDIQQPRTGRSDLQPPRRDLGQRILAGLTAEVDTLPSSSIGASPDAEM
jgi:beta-lactamase regulating signal transducer with metallopeptidase domain